MTRALTCFAAGAIAVATAACQFSPTAPFSGFDRQGSRVVGRFESEMASVTAVSTQNTAPASTAGVQGIVVMLSEQPSVKTTVDQNGGFTVAGVPSGSFTLVFLRDGQNIGEVRLKYVRKNQGIRITLLLTSGGEAVLVKEQRDQVSFSGECPRGPGFWCQNQGGQNPNLSKAEFDAFAEEAARLLSAVPALDTPGEVAAAVCNTGNQFVRHLAALALNLAAKTVKPDTSLAAEEAPYLTVRDAFEAAVAHLAGSTPLSGSQQEALKDVMDRINNAQNITGCNQLTDEDDEPAPTQPTDTSGTNQPGTDPPASGPVTICHIPPGNYNARQTITIDASAWPAHQSHCAQGVCDYKGSCR